MVPSKKLLHGCCVVERENVASAGVFIATLARDDRPKLARGIKMMMMMFIAVIVIGKGPESETEIDSSVRKERRRQTSFPCDIRSI